MTRRAHRIDEANEFLAISIFIARLFTFVFFLFSSLALLLLGETISKKCCEFSNCARESTTQNDCSFELTFATEKDTLGSPVTG